MCSKVTLLVWAGMAFTAGPVAQAQDAGPSPKNAGRDTEAAVQAGGEGAPAPSGKSRFIEEIIVTSQKREENLQDVPISVQAFSADLLDARGITNQSELQQITPSLDVGNQVGYTTFYLRGIGTDAYLTADPSVASYIDGIYFPFAQGLVQDFGAVQRIEVLKGPQGTLFGRNAVGGAISVITRAPDFATQENAVQVSYGKYNDFRSRVYSNIPLTDQLAASVSAIYNASENYIDGTVAGHELPLETSRGARLKLRWAPMENMEFNFAALKLNAGGANSIIQLNRFPSVAGALVGIEPQRGYTAELSEGTFQQISNTVVYGDATLNTNWFDIKLLGSDQYINTSGLLDFDGSSAPLVHVESRKQYGDIQTGELQLLSNQDSWGSTWLKWIGGAYYFKGEQGFDPVDIVARTLGSDGGRLYAIALPADVVNSIQDILNPAGLDFLDGVRVRLTSPVGTESWSAFAQATFTISEAIALTLGARYQKEKRFIIDSSSSVVLPDGTVVPLFNFEGATDKEGRQVSPENVTESVKPKVSLDLHPFGDNTLVYASYQQAIKAATYNAVNIYTQPRFVKPEEIAAYELGVKGQLFGGLMQYSAAAFHYQTKNLQVQFVSLLAGGAVTFENAEESRSKGVDADFSVVLAPQWTDDLVLSAGAAYVDSRFIEFANGTGFSEGAGVYTTGNDFSGNRTPRSPKFSGNMALSKTWAITAGAIELAGDIYYNDGFFYASANTTQSHQPAYQIVGARVSYLYEPWQLRVTLYGKNLLDEEYTTGVFGQDFGTSVTVAPPLTYGVRLNWEF